MITYKDMTFCRSNTCNHFVSKECHRALTQEVFEAAIQWWGSPDAPIMTFAAQPDCFNKDIEKEDNSNGITTTE